LFRIEIPISESSAQDDLSLDDTKSNDKLGILIVDDNLELLELIQRTLTRLGHQVESAEHGQEALEQISKQHFDLVISDVNMPHMDGIELSKRVSDIPIILMSGYASQAMIKQIDEGSILKKPFKMSQLVDRIKQEVQRPTQPS
jgi:CheY-like chemotaxis protein